MEIKLKIADADLSREIAFCQIGDAKVITVSLPSTLLTCDKRDAPH